MLCNPFNKLLVDIYVYHMFICTIDWCSCVQNHSFVLKAYFRCNRMSRLFTVYAVPGLHMNGTINNEPMGA